jgi:hypothetical protein
MLCPHLRVTEELSLVTMVTGCGASGLRAALTYETGLHPDQPTTFYARY